MSDLEGRLRAALRERADDFTASPGAWERTVARAKWSRAAESRRPSAWRWRARRLRSRGPLARFASAGLAPLAAAAVVVAIVVAIGAVSRLAGRDQGRPGGGVTAGGSASAGSDAMPLPPGVDSSMLRSIPPGTAVVQVTQAYGGQVSWTYFWFGHGAKANQMCADTVSDQLGSQSTSVGFSASSANGARNGAGTSTGSALSSGAGASQCGPVGLPPGQLAASVGGNELAASVWQGLGIAARQTASVTAVLPGGSQVPGVVGSGRGFRCKVWVVTYPQRYVGHTTLLFRDSAGHVVARLAGQ